MLGRHNLTSRTERKSETRDVENILIHEDWKYYDSKFDADLAILVIDQNVKFSDFIKPVCMTSNSEMQGLTNSVVVGWGKSENPREHEDVPREAVIHAASDAECFENQFSIGSIFTRRMFCAKGKAAGPCRGDSGGGFYVKYRQAWTLKGIVSAGDDSCDVNSYTLYTKVSDFHDWIKATVAANP